MPAIELEKACKESCSYISLFCKMYRLAADIFNDAAMILDCLSPAFPKATRVILLSQSSVLRSLCGVAAGSSKASLSAHFATQGNLGELNAVCLISLLE